MPVGYADLDRGGSFPIPRFRGDPRHRPQTPRWHAHALDDACAACGGNGQVITEHCSKCGGQGASRVTRTIDVNIPPGVDNGSEISFSNFIIACQVAGSSKFRRRGYDIVTEKEISFAQAALGTILEIETVDGPVKIRIPAGTQSGTQIRLRGKGVRHVTGRGQGDHYVIIRVKVPSKLSREQKRLLDELESLS